MLRPWLCSAEYYRRLHADDSKYSANNWLVSDIDLLKTYGGKSLLEVGCGNGKFLKLAADHWPTVAGTDWARSPQIDAILREHPNAAFHESDIRRFNPPNFHFDIVVSADFFEHIAERDLSPLIAKMHSWGGTGFHKIACYDDGHSHLSVLPPEAWLGLFQKVDPTYRIAQETLRKKDRPVIVVTNAGP